VDDDGVAVLGQLHVELEPVGTKVDRPRERGHRVFRRIV